MHVKPRKCTSLQVYASLCKFMQVSSCYTRFPPNIPSPSLPLAVVQYNYTCHTPPPRSVLSRPRPHRPTGYRRTPHTLLPAMLYSAILRKRPSPNKNNNKPLLWTPITKLLAVKKSEHANVKNLTKIYSHKP